MIRLCADKPRVPMPFSRRFFFAGLIALFASAPAFASLKHRKQPAAPRHGRPLRPTEVPKLTGTPLPIPPVVDLVPGVIWELKAEPVSHAFLADKPVEIIGYNGLFPGPTIRMTRGTTTTVRFVNALSRPASLQWHGLVAPAMTDAAQGLAQPDATLEHVIAVSQPPATLWYHEALLSPPSPDQPFGLAIVADPADAALSLPAQYGIDDFPVILHDRTFDATGRPVDPAIPDAGAIGARGATVLVNGIADALLKVPQRLVRLRLLNAARARVFRLFMDDERSFWLVATDGGYLKAPDEIDTLILAPGERAEIIVDFADGSTALMSTPDDVTVHGKPGGEDDVHHADLYEKPFRVLAFEAIKDAIAAKPLPTQLPAEPMPAAPETATHRRFELTVTSGGADLATTVATINGRVYDPKRVDVTVRRGTPEIWQICAPTIASSVHVTGARIRVLSEDGEPPRAWNSGPKDTVFVENALQLEVLFPEAATAAAPFTLAATVPDQAAAGAAATIVVE